MRKQIHREVQKHDIQNSVPQTFHQFSSYYGRKSQELFLSKVLYLKRQFSLLATNTSPAQKACWRKGETPIAQRTEQNSPGSGREGEEVSKSSSILPALPGFWDPPTRSGGEGRLQTGSAARSNEGTICAFAGAWHLFSHSFPL